MLVRGAYIHMVKLMAGKSEVKLSAEAVGFGQLDLNSASLSEACME